MDRGLGSMEKLQRRSVSINVAVIFVGGKDRGVVRADGVYNIRVPAVVNKDQLVAHEGRLAGENGKGSYHIEKCFGTSSLKRIEKN